VGTFALQPAKAFGAEVTGVDAPGRLDVLRSIGADRVVDYTQEDFTRTGERYDFILDLAGNHPWSECKRALTPDGTYVLSGYDQFGSSGHRWFGSLGRFAKLIVVSPFVSYLHPFRGTKDPGDRLVVLKELIEARKITPAIDRRSPSATFRKRSATWRLGGSEGRSSSPSRDPCRRWLRSSGPAQALDEDPRSTLSSYNGMEQTG
jgi:NADPH:quinone reductase-like Zn-dependent oxidoreductase